ncbi:MAG: coproporphyrinogen III oxidase [Novosphingobium sp. 28-62-57]|uniref:radical SAM family heme chaperone HemW n=1 Tax=unclassified Novosphingobium TaxID=2644732 RepID=UPI000BD8B37D|nr:MULTISPECIES: radical SAM family heme chaperone HemW [unclassified Novosphingobium]OYW49670.1 MAG: coproporphyrinogen III oxidase [Novosphingobium sp. 12-62-10]OYZ12373.1 MAG: coproporphyrinogen III oxidase [Novosphingobium sp. 28-62-57]OZA30983.1 MAG: coproporphyrinogen III oxidase [Novosphingobium sp. 17-62-9]
MQPLALYIHWPFCLAKCPYCDFNSHVRAKTDVAAWTAALLADMRHEARLTSGRPLTSIFFGGGTPSLMPPVLVDALLREAEALWGFAPGIEITLEANPSSVEAANFTALATAGINRVSLGLQALDDKTLKFLGRLHDVSESLAALELAQKTYARVSFDLIYARPEQTPEAWEAELKRALGFGTGHLSLYQLTIEPGTRFATLVREGKLTPLDDDAGADLFALTRELTSTACLPAYETSNHARPGEESRHNLIYWRYQDYIGIGPGAHGRRLGAATVRHKKPENFLRAVTEQAHGIAEERLLPMREQATEALLMGLRLTEGISPPALAARFGLSEDEMIDRKACERLATMGFLKCTKTHLTVTEQGAPLLEALLADIVSHQLVSA